MTIDYGRYARLSLWSSGEGVCLLVGVVPNDWSAQLKAELFNEEPDELDVAFSISREGWQRCQQEKAIGIMRRKKIAEAQALMSPIEECLERDLLAGLIAPAATKDGTNYFTPSAFVTWAASKGFDIPNELQGLILPNQESTSKPLQSPFKAPANENGGKATRASQLHVLIWKVRAHVYSNGKGSAQKVWLELQLRHNLHDTEGIIQEVTSKEISWQSANGNEPTFKRTSLDALLTRLKKTPPS